jgi:urease accessory protein
MMAMYPEHSTVMTKLKREAVRGEDDVAARPVRRALDEHCLRLHLPVVFGFLLGLALRIEPAQSTYMYLYLMARGMLSAAVRLGLLGPMRSAFLLRELSGVLLRLLSVDPAEAAGSPRPPSYSVAPIMEIYQGLHDRLFSRIFNS